MSYVRLVNVTKRFGAVTAVDHLNIAIERGECFSMLGPSGCGKTTTLRMVAGFEDLDDGEIHVGERLLSSRARNFYLPPEKRGFGMVFQAFAVWPHLSVYENVAFPLRVRKLGSTEIDRRTRAALEHTGLLSVAQKSPEDLSGGGKQRVALARALAINPDVMLLDEPLSSLDPHLREEMRFEIKDLQRQFGFSIIYVTHDQAEAMALSDRILVMNLGVVQQVDTPLNVYQNPANRFVFGFIGLSNFLDVSIHGDAVRVRGEGGRPGRADHCTRCAEGRRPGGARQPPLGDRFCCGGRRARGRQALRLSGRDHRLPHRYRGAGSARAEEPARPRPPRRGGLRPRVRPAALVSRRRKELIARRS